MVLVLYVGGENYQTDRDDAMRWLWGSKDHMVHRRVRRLGMRIWRIRYDRRNLNLACWAAMDYDGYRRMRAGERHRC